MNFHLILFILFRFFLFLLFHSFLTSLYQNVVRKRESELSQFVRNLYIMYSVYTDARIEIFRRFPLIRSLAIIHFA